MGLHSSFTTHSIFSWRHLIGSKPGPECTRHLAHLWGVLLWTRWPNSKSPQWPRGQLQVVCPAPLDYLVVQVPCCTFPPAAAHLCFPTVPPPCQCWHFPQWWQSNILSSGAGHTRQASWFTHCRALSALVSLVPRYICEKQNSNQILYLGDMWFQNTTCKRMHLEETQGAEPIALEMTRETALSD